MSKYVIHACPQRMWYVNDFLIPSLKNQGIEDIDVRCDTQKLGNLEKCMNIFSVMNEEGGSWHLQDDVIICRDFAERTKKYSGDDVVCGYVWENSTNLDKIGWTAPQDMWWSFPCIYIPNKMARECSKWYYGWAKRDEKYKIYFGKKQYDDYFFREFLLVYYPEIPVLHIKPCLVDHIDYLIGGTTILPSGRGEESHSKWFEDPDLVDELKMKLEGYRHG